MTTSYSNKAQYLGSITPQELGTEIRQLIRCICRFGFTTALGPWERYGFVLCPRCKKKIEYKSLNILD